MQKERLKEKEWFNAPSLIAATGQQPHNTKDKDEHAQTFPHTHIETYTDLHINAAF